MADEVRQIILKVNTETGDASASLKGVNDQLGNIGNTIVKDEEKFISLKNQIKQATLDAQKLGEEFGRNSTQFANAAQKVANLKDKFEDTNAVIKGFNPDNKLQGLIGIAGGAAVAVQGIAGAFTLVGVSTEDAAAAVARLQGLMAFTNALGQIDSIKNSFTSLSGAIQSTTLYQNLFNTSKAEGTVATTANTVATGAAVAVQEAETAAVVQTSAAMGGLKSAMIATGIGAFVIAIGFVVAKLIEWREETAKADKAQKEISKTLEDFAKGAAQATLQVNEVETAFKLFHEGTISKKEALQKYNDTLGDAFGKTNDLAKAEKLLADKAQAYIEITGLKAQANALFTLSAQKTADALLANETDQRGFLDKAKSGLQQYLGLYSSSIETTINAQKEGVASVVEEANSSAEALKKKGEELLSKAGDLAKSAGINSNLVDNKSDNTSTKKDNSKDEKLKALEAAQKEISDFLKKSRQELLEQNRTDEEIEILQLNDRYQKEIDLAKKFGIDTSELLANQLSEENAIRFKFAEIRREEKIKQDAQDKIEAAKSVQKGVQDKISNNDESSRNKIDKANLDNAPDKNDGAKKAKEKIEAIRNVELEEEQVSFNLKLELLKANALVQAAEEERIYQEKLLKAQGNAEQIAAIEAEHATAIDGINKDKDEKVTNATAANANKKKKINTESAKAEKEIDKAAMQSKLEIAGQVANGLNTLSELVGKKTAAGKALAVAAATIDTIKGGISAFTGMTAQIPGPVGIALGVVAAAGVVASGYASIKKILAVKVPGAAEAPAPPAPTAPTLDSTVLNLPQGTQDVRVTNEPGQTVIKAYITNDELNTNAEKQNFYNKLSSF